MAYEDEFDEMLEDVIRQEELGRVSEEEILRASLGRLNKRSSRKGIGRKLIDMIDRIVKHV